MNIKPDEIYYKEIFQKAPLAIVLISTDGTILDVNKEFINLFRYSKEELLGNNLDDIITNEESKKEAINLTHKVLNSKVEIETIRYDKFKNPIDVAALATTFQDYRGNQLIFVTYKKITEKKFREKKIQMQKEIIKLINKILRHDLMNYFSVIRSAFRIYKETKEEELLSEAQIQAEKGIELIRSLKRFEQFESGEDSLEIINVRKEIEEIASTFFNVEIKIYDDIKIKGDKTFDRIIENLINNAIKHGKATKIEIELLNKENEKIILVKDNGKGIPDKIKNVIFQEGFSYGKSGNTGLGLFIVKKLMEIFNGKVEVRDNIPSGAIFELHFFE